jgi:hypothetical protein
MSEPVDPQTAADALLVLEWATFNRMGSDNAAHHRFDSYDAAYQFSRAHPKAHDARRAEAALVTLLGFGLVKFVERRAFRSTWTMDGQVAGRMRASLPRGRSWWDVRKVSRRTYEAAIAEADARYMASLPEDEQRRIAAVRAAILVHPQSRAWELLVVAEHDRGDSLSPPGPDGYFRHVLRRVQRRDSLANLIEESLAKLDVPPDDPFRAELIENLVKTAKSDAALRLTDDTWPPAEKAETRK